MIQLNEIRLGNLVKADNEKIWNSTYNGSIVAVDIDILMDIFKDENLYSPIPLSVELLEQAGFKWQGGDHYANEENDIWIEDKSGLYRFARPFLTKYNLKYLHQLQNLYFALTGTELEVNLNQPNTIK
jgi:hypothetical protein